MTPSSELKKSPLHERHVALGAKFAEFGGWEMPLEYSGVVAEHTAVRTSVGVFDVSHLGKATVKGPGAASYVNSCLTNDLGKIAPGQAQYTLCCNERGEHRRGGQAAAGRRARRCRGDQHPRRLRDPRGPGDPQRRRGGCGRTADRARLHVL